MLCSKGRVGSSPTTGTYKLATRRLSRSQSAVAFAADEAIDVEAAPRQPAGPAPHSYASGARLLSVNRDEAPHNFSTLQALQPLRDIVWRYGARVDSQPLVGHKPQHVERIGHAAAEGAA